MKTVDPIFLLVISDLFVNLSAGWIGAALILPTNLPRNRKGKVWVLIIDLGYGILILVIAYTLRSFGP